MLNFIRQNKWILVGVLVVLCLGYWLGLRGAKGTGSYPGSGQMPTIDKQVVTQSTNLDVSAKGSPKDPDLIINNSYTAKVNGETLSVPSVPKTSTFGDTTTVTQEIDITPLIARMRPQWELGVGVGVHERDVYIPLSIQRNYKEDRGLYLEVHMDPRDNFKVTGAEVQHKWFFR